MTDPRGTPIWFEHGSVDPQKAAAFYGSVAHWSVGSSQGPDMGGYRLASAPDGTQVAGLAPRSGDMGLPGWSLWFAADDVDALAATVVAQGGTLRFGPRDIPGVGRFATAADPQGNAFQIMRSDDADAATAYLPDDAASLGHGVWIELATPDPDGAFAFYGALFGWTRAAAMPMGAMGDYAFIGTTASGGGEHTQPDTPTGLGAIMSSMLTGAPARWNWYVRVADIDTAVAAAQAAGGTLVQGPDAIPGERYSANLLDDQGHAIGLIGTRGG